MGIEPTSRAWEALVLPLNYTRKRRNAGAFRACPIILAPAAFDKGAAGLAKSSSDMHQLLPLRAPNKGRSSIVSSRRAPTLTRLTGTPVCSVINSR